MSPFTPVGDRARWRVVYSELAGLDVDQVITYEQLGEALGLDATKDRHRIQMAVRRAAQEHEQVDKRALDVVTNVGYRVVRAPEHVGLARRQQRRSSRALVRGHSKAVNVDLNGVDQATRQALDTVARAFAMQMDFNRRFDVRQRHLEDTLSTVAGKADRSADEIAELRSRLDRLEDSD
jgi:hypothetical protein